MGNCLSSKEPSKGGARAHTLAAIRDRFETIEEVQQALKESGLESSEVCSLFQICYPYHDCLFPLG